MTVGVVRALEAFVHDVSNWYIRRSRRRFYGDDPGRIPHALVRPRPGAPRPLTDHAVPPRPSLAEPRLRRVRGCSGERVPGSMART